MSDYKRLTEKGSCYYDEMDRLIVDEIYERLAELEDKIENGTLIELPCKVGDKVYYVNENSPTPRIEEYVVYGILLDESRIILHIDYWETIMAKDVYYTKPEAKARLEQIRKENSNG